MFDYNSFFMLSKKWLKSEVPYMGNAELKVVLYVMKHAWDDKINQAKAISLDEFMHGKLAKHSDQRIDSGTGLSKRSVLNGIRNAVENNFLVVYTDNRDAARIRKYYMPRMNPTVKKETFAVDPKTGERITFEQWRELAAPVENNQEPEGNVRYFEKNLKDFFVAPKEMFNLRAMSNVELRVLLHIFLCTWGHDELVKSITVEDFINATKLSKKSVIKGLKELLKDGLVSAYVDNKGKGNRKNKHYMIRWGNVGLFGETYAVNHEIGIEITYEQWLKLSTNKQSKRQETHQAGCVKSTPENQNAASASQNRGIESTPGSPGVKSIPLNRGIKSTPGAGVALNEQQTRGVESTPGNQNTVNAPQNTGVKSTPGSPGVKITPLNSSIKSTPGTSKKPQDKTETSSKHLLSPVNSDSRISNITLETGSTETVHSAQKSDVRVEKVDIPGVQTTHRTKKDISIKKDISNDIDSTSTYGTCKHKSLKERDKDSYTSLTRSITHKCDTADSTKLSKNSDKPTNKDIIAELTGHYRKIKGVMSEPSDFSFIGKLYNEHGYNDVLWMINKVSRAVESGKIIHKPKIYIMKALKNEAKNSSPSGKQNQKGGKYSNGQYQRRDAGYGAFKDIPEPGSYEYQFGYARDGGTGEIINLFDIERELQAELAAKKNKAKPEPGSYEYKLGYARDAGTGELINIYDRRTAGY